MEGKVYLVGAGPGRADLITVRGLEVLRQADVVIYDYLADRGVLKETKPGAELICCGKLAKKGLYSDGLSIRQDKIHTLVIKKAKQGKKVVRLKNGDPAFFSRLSEELDALSDNKINFEIIPGVTAASAASAFSGIPLTDRQHASSCVFVTGHEDPKKKGSAINWKDISRCGTIVLYMALKNLDNIAKELLLSPRPKDTPCVLVQDAGLFTQKTVVGTLGDIASRARNEKIKPPVIVIIGDVVNLEGKFNWLKKDRRILFTGLSKERFFLEGICVHFPLIRISPLSGYKEFDSHLKNISDFDWLIFTSRYGVKYFFERLAALGLDSRSLGLSQIAAIGTSTKNALMEHGINPDLIPKEESSAGLVREFNKINLKGKKIFLPRSDLSDKGLTDRLKIMGAKVKASVAYRNEMPENLPDLKLESFDEIIFTSPSGVRNFMKRYGPVPEGIKVSCIGEVTRGEVGRWLGKT